MPNKPTSTMKARRSEDRIKWVMLSDAGVATAFAGAIAVLLLIACYVVGRLAGDRAHREKWRDYNDCGWA